MHVNKRQRTATGSNVTSGEGPPEIDDRKRKALDVAAKLAELAGISANFQRNQLATKKLFCPKELLHIDWVQLITGPQGLTMRALQMDTKCRFRFCGRGSNKNGPDEDGNSDLYIFITAENQDDLSKGINRLETVFYDEDVRRQLMDNQGGNAGVIPGIGRKAEIYMIPSDKVGLVIGKGGSMIVKIQQLSGCQLQVDRESDPQNPTRRRLFLCGTDDQLKKAKSHIDDVVAGFRPEAPGEITKYECVPQRMIGRVIGKGGETIRRLERDHTCMVKVLPGPPSHNIPDGFPEEEIIREVMLRGFPPNVQAVQYEVQQLTDFSGTHLTRDMAIRQKDAIAQGVRPDNLPAPPPKERKIFIQVRIPENLVGRLLSNAGAPLQTIERDSEVSISLVPNPDLSGLRNLTMGGAEKSVAGAKEQLDQILGTSLPQEDIMETSVWKPGPDYARYTDVYNNMNYYQQPQPQQQQYPAYPPQQQYPGYPQQPPQQQQMNPYGYQQQQQQQQPYYPQQQQMPQQGYQPPAGDPNSSEPPKKLSVQEQIAQMKAKVAKQKAAQTQVMNGTVMKPGAGNIVQHKLANGQVIHQLPNGEFIQLQPGQQIELVEGENETIDPSQILRAV